MSEKKRNSSTFDKVGVPKSEERRFNILALLGEKVLGANGKEIPKYTQDEVAKMSNCCKKTVSNYWKQAKVQHVTMIQTGKTHKDGSIPYVPDHVPEPGKQGGFRWSRMNEMQQEICIQLAMEHPRDTLKELKAKMQERFPELANISDSTIWRTLETSGIKYKRAKLKDPLGEGPLATQAKKKELESFITEQDKSDAGMLNPINLFFMDETIVTLNEVATRGWGTKHEPPEISKSKGKTLTLNLYVGLGLVSDVYGENFSEEVKDPGCKIDATMPRGNHIEYDKDSKCWQLAREPPKFALFWWIRPPTRSGTALSRFLGMDDILDPNFRLFDPSFLLRKNTKEQCKVNSVKKFQLFQKSNKPKTGTEIKDEDTISELKDLEKETTFTVEDIPLSKPIYSRQFFRNDEKYIVIKNMLDDYADEQSCGFFRPALILERKIFDKKVLSITLHDPPTDKSINLFLDCEKQAIPRDKTCKIVHITTEHENLAVLAYKKENNEKTELLSIPFEWTPNFTTYPKTAKFEYAGFVFENKVLSHRSHYTSLKNFLEENIVSEILEEIEDKSHLTTIKKLLWLNGIEYRQVDKDDGSLIKIDVTAPSGNKKTRTHVDLSLKEMIALFKEFQILVKNALKIDTSQMVSKFIPRQFYTATGRNTMGGKVESERGDRALFIKYLIEATNYYDTVFPSSVVENLRIAWDSAPQHGKIDVDSKHYSYIHEWTEQNLNVPCIFLPVKAPDYNPAENLIGYIKAQIRLKQRSFTGEATVSKMVELIDSAMSLVTEQMVRGWVRYGCYKIPGDDTPLDKERCIEKSLELKKPPNFMDMALRIWKDTTLKKYPLLQNSELFTNGQFRPEVLKLIKYEKTDDTENIIQLERYLKKYDTIQDALRNLPFSEQTDQTDQTSQKTLGLDEKIVLTIKCFGYTFDANVLEKVEYNERTSTLKITRKDFPNPLKYVIDVVNKKATCSLEETSNGTYELKALKASTANTHLSKEDIIEFKKSGKTVVKFQNSCKIHIQNYKVPEYKELYEIAKKCTEDANFPCMATIIRHLANDDVEDKKHLNSVKEYVSYISDYISENRGPLHLLKICRRYVSKILNMITDDEHSKIHSRLDVLLKGFTPIVTKNMQIKSIPDAADASIIIEFKNGIKINTIELNKNDQNLTEPFLVDEVGPGYFKVNGEKTFKNPLHFEASDEMQNEMEKIRTIVEKTPYSASLPPEADAHLALSTAVIVEKAIQHEQDILKLINNQLAHLLESEIDENPNKVDWSKVASICQEAITKLKRKCKTCEKTKFKRFPVFNIYKEQDKYNETAEMRRKAFAKKSGDDRRWPGYPQTSYDQLKEDGYKERGNGPDFKVVGDKGERRLSNILQNVQIVENDPKSVRATIDGEQIILNEENNKEEWQRYFGPFAKENQLQLHLARQRMKEDQAKFKKTLDKDIITDLSIKPTNEAASAHVVAPDGTALFSEVIKTPATGTDFIYFRPSGPNSENRLYPPIDKSLEEFLKEFKSSQTNPKILLLTDDKYEIDLENNYIKNSLQLTVGSGRRHLHLKDQQNNYQFGFDLKTMFEPFPRKKLGIDLKLEYLTTSKRNFYIVKDTVFKEFFKEFFKDSQITLDQKGIQHQNMILKFVEHKGQNIPLGDFETYKGFIINKNAETKSFKHALDKMRLKNTPEENKDILLKEFLITKTNIDDFTQKIKRQDIVSFGKPVALPVQRQLSPEV